jgi:hypothetical protein
LDHSEARWLFGIGISPTKDQKMETDGSDRIQDLQSRLGALNIALERTLAELVELYGTEARPKIEAMRDDLIHTFKNSGIPAERELEHGRIVQPSIDVLETVFNAVLDRIER